MACRGPDGNAMHCGGYCSLCRILHHSIAPVHGVGVLVSRSSSLFFLILLLVLWKSSLRHLLESLLLCRSHLALVRLVRPIVDTSQLCRDAEASLTRSCSVKLITLFVSIFLTFVQVSSRIAFCITNNRWHANTTLWAEPIHYHAYTTLKTYQTARYVSIANHSAAAAASSSNNNNWNTGYVHLRAPTIFLRR